MKTKSFLRAGFFVKRTLPALTLSFVGVLLALGSFVVTDKPHKMTDNTRERERYMPVAGEKGEDLERMEQEWNNRLTYPTGLFNPLWLRLAAAQDSLINSAIPLGTPLSASLLAASPL